MARGAGPAGLSSNRIAAETLHTERDETDYMMSILPLAEKDLDDPAAFIRERQKPTRRQPHVRKPLMMI
jgi:hypothetical protein